MNWVFGYILCIVFFNIFHCTLGEKYQTRIVNGAKAAQGQFPWQVILKRDEWDDLLCGGSIISANWVLTAGHCTYGLESVFLMFGSILLENENALNMTSDELFIHPKYNSRNLNYDVSMIHLPEALVFSETIAPIALVPSSEAADTFVGNTAVISGFGFVEDVNLDFSPNLLYAYVTVINNSLCAWVYGNDVVLDSTLCTVGARNSNMSICNGDSGGPLISWDSNGQLMQIGINSYVKEDACTLKYPAGYARISYFLNYIETTMLTFANGQ